MNYCILIAGMGRCGTTILFENLQTKVEGGSQFIKDLSSYKNYKKGFIYKTHDYPPSHFPIDCKVVYLFGNPMDVAISSHKTGVICPQHYQHLKSPNYEKRDQFHKEDTLLLEKNFDAWNQEQNFSLMMVKYDDLWQSQGPISRFLGIDVELPPKKARKTNWINHPYKEDLEKTYGKLKEKIDQEPAYKFL